MATRTFVLAVAVGVLCLSVLLTAASALHKDRQIGDLRTRVAGLERQLQATQGGITTIRQAQKATEGRASELEKTIEHLRQESTYWHPGALLVAPR